MSAVEQCPMKTGVRTELAPMATDRAGGWRFFREHGPVFEDASGMYCCTDREGVRFIARNPEIFSSYLAYKDLQGVPDNPPVPLAVDPPDHLKFRQLVDRMFSPRVLKPLEDDLRRQAADLIDGFADNGRCEIMADFAQLYPTQVFLTLFGLPIADRDMITRWVHDMNSNVGFSAEGGIAPVVQEASDAMTAYLREFIEEKRKRPGDDVLSKVLAVTGDGAWTYSELLGFAFTFTNAGLDTVTASTGFVMEHLANNPEQRRQLVADPSRLRPTVEELLRLEPVIPLIPRVTTRDVEVCGYPIPSGKVVLMAFGAINREPALYPTPDALDIGEADRGHLAFGTGIHRCPGSHLARIELGLMIEEFHRRIPHYEIEPGSVPRLKWPAGVVSYDALPLVWSI